MQFGDGVPRPPAGAPGPPFPGTPDGAEGMRKAGEIFRGAFPDWRSDVQQLIAEGDLVAENFVAHGTHRGAVMGETPTGREVTLRGVNIFRIADGKIVERWGHLDQLGLLQQLGLAPPTATRRDAVLTPSGPTDVLRMTAAHDRRAAPLRSTSARQGDVAALAGRTVGARFYAGAVRAEDEAGEIRPEDRYADLVDELLGIDGVAPPGGGGGFGRTALRFRGKIFAMVVRGRLVVKLPAARVDSLIAAGDGVHFDANKGKPMKEWLSLDPESPRAWLPLAREALDFARRASR